MDEHRSRKLLILLSCMYFDSLQLRDMYDASNEFEGDDIVEKIQM